MTMFRGMIQNRNVACRQYHLFWSLSDIHELIHASMAHSWLPSRSFIVKIVRCNRSSRMDKKKEKQSVLQLLLGLWRG